MAEDARVRGAAARGALVAQAYQSPRRVSSGMRPIWRNWDALGITDVYGAARMYGGAAWVWEVYGARKPMKTKNMAVECDLRTLCVFGNIWRRHLDMEGRPTV